MALTVAPALVARVSLVRRCMRVVAVGPGVVAAAMADSADLVECVVLVAGGGAGDRIGDRGQPAGAVIAVAGASRRRRFGWPSARRWVVLNDAVPDRPPVAVQQAAVVIAEGVRAARLGADADVLRAGPCRNQKSRSGVGCGRSPLPVCLVRIRRVRRSLAVSVTPPGSVTSGLPASALYRSPGCRCGRPGSGSSWWTGRSGIRGSPQLLCSRW